MADFNGTRFDYFDDEMTDPDKPLSTFREHSARNQLAYLDINRGNRITYNRKREVFKFTQFDDVRAYASYARTCIWMAPYFVAPNLDVIRLELLGHVNTQAPAPTSIVGVYLTLELEGITEETIFVPSNADYSRIEIELNVGRFAPPSQAQTRLRLWMRSVVTGTQTSTSQYTAGGLLNDPIRPPNNASEVWFVTGPSIYPSDASTPPSTTSYNEQATQIGEGIFMDHALWLDPGRMLGIWQQTPSNADDYATVHLSYIQLHGFHMEEQYTSTVPSTELLRAKIPTLGTTEIQFAAKAQDIHRRPRILSLGPEGDAVASGLETWQYPFEEWTYSPKNVTPTFDVVWNALGFLDDPAPQIDVLLDVIPIHLVSDYSKGTFEALIEDSTNLEWEFRTDITQQSTGGSSTLVTGDTITQRLVHFPCDRTGVWPFLMQMMWRYHGSEAPQHGTYKEGQLFDADMPLVQRVRIPVDASSITAAQRDLPITILTGLEQGATDPVFLYTPSNQTNTREHLVVVIVGGTIVARY